MINKPKSRTTKLAAYVISALSYSSTSNAAVTVVDIPDINIHQFTTQLGNHPMFSFGHTGELRLVGGGFLFVNAIEIGSNSNGDAFFQSGESATITSEATFKSYASSNSFFAGASSGINYARITGNDATKRYYIVVEFDFGVDADPSDDVITKYAYENTDPNLFFVNGAPSLTPTTLTIAEAEAAFAAVPEPSSAILLGLGSLALLLRRRK